MWILDHPVIVVVVVVVRTYVRVFGSRVTSYGLRYTILQFFPLTSPNAQCTSHSAHSRQWIQLEVPPPHRLSFLHVSQFHISLLLGLNIAIAMAMALVHLIIHPLGVYLAHNPNT
ncbi:hypothetical protein L226DRAFT_536232 [Lentinus tigrinus ALCF2SS1-7]|uniref:Uncharacterized protein n=1 Tax=Lentinus tigrinus ALCF2SS1-6 TaxID=1328759 RepID=A0A5C2S817_9APHY|nr:hypothetical protein L227DRAFT_576445 [Lentinus tigrinus ALCF2SS1-6]RPD73551.1 hypothetical protein L226DRAFT_536232 [Lentinus tigrinus ALCF2SS1-7]